MDYQQLYQRKQMTAEEAVGCVRDGDWIEFGYAACTPVALDQALAKRMPQLRDINLRGSIVFWEPEIFRVPDPAEHFTWNSCHMTGIDRPLVQQGFCFHVPVRYSELPRYCREHPCRVFMAQVTPMDEHGYFNFGLNASHLIAAMEHAEVILVEVNENMPRCLGGRREGVHISQVDGVILGDNPPIAEMPSGPITEVDQAVARQIVAEIPDGACLQLGIGGMPNAVGSLIAETDLKDLGVHTEMYVDAFVDLTLAGKITGQRKVLDPGRQVYTFGAGTKKVYDFLDNNPVCMAADVEYVNDIRTIAALDNFISINNAVDIDLFGQVNAESSGVRHISGAGGQLDFVLGAYLSQGGKSFICLSSTYRTKDGALRSRIRPTLAPGSIVTDTRANVHYVVTEYGMINLKGLTTWQRAEGLISLAHPDFREELIAQAERMHIWRRSNRR